MVPDGAWPWALTWSLVAMGNHMTLCCNRTHRCQLKPWLLWVSGSSLGLDDNMAGMAIQVTPISVALAMPWPWDTYMDSGGSPNTGHPCGHVYPSPQTMAVVGPQTQARPCAARWTWTSPGLWVAREPSTSAFSSPPLCFFSVTFSHSMWMILLLFLSHFSATYLLIIMGPIQPQS